MGKKNNQQRNKVADYTLADAGLKICSLTKKVVIFVSEQLLCAGHPYASAVSPVFTLLAIVPT